MSGSPGKLRKETLVCKERDKERGTERRSDDVSLQGLRCGDNAAPEPYFLGSRPHPLEEHSHNLSCELSVFIS